MQHSCCEMKLNTAEWFLSEFEKKQKNEICVSGGSCVMICGIFRMISRSKSSMDEAMWGRDNTDQGCSIHVPRLTYALLDWSFSHICSKSAIIWRLDLDTVSCHMFLSTNETAYKESNATWLSSDPTICRNPSFFLPLYLSHKLPVLINLC